MIILFYSLIGKKNRNQKKVNFRRMVDLVKGRSGETPRTQVPFPQASYFATYSSVTFPGRLSHLQISPPGAFASSLWLTLRHGTQYDTHTICLYKGNLKCPDLFPKHILWPFGLLCTLGICLTLSRLAQMPSNFKTRSLKIGKRNLIENPLLIKFLNKCITEKWKNHELITLPPTIIIWYTSCRLFS